MKKCLNCGYECGDYDIVCPVCGMNWDNDTNRDKHYNNNQQHSNVDFESAVKSFFKNNMLKSTFSNQMPQGDEGNKLFNFLWVLFSFIPFVNGYGIFYVGKKTSNRSWIIEGALYEVPIILYLLIKPSIFTFGLVIVSTIISIIRSIMIIPKYKTILNVRNHKKLNNKIFSFLLFISSFVPVLNGIGFIYFGKKYSRWYLFEGYLLELIWITVIISFSFIPVTFRYIGILAGVTIASLVVSGMSMISFNFDANALYHYVDSSPYKINKNNQKYVEDKYDYYKIQLDDLKDEFDAKEKKLRKLIKERFGSGNLTSNRFLGVINNSHENVYRELNSGYDIIKYTSEPSQQVEEELKESITNINSINDEMEKLTVELILNTNEDTRSDDNIKNLVDDMEDLINDINKYE